ncbi:MAG: hypothetical protein AAF849_25265 [Bacteroidota bacterium]
MPIQNPLRCILFWLILVVLMILHFNYHVSEIFYGIDVVQEDAAGKVPIGIHFIRNIFYHLPIVWIVVLMSTNKKVIRLGLFIISLIYTLSHAMHLVGELLRPDISQISLLSLMLFISVLLSISHFKYWKKELSPQQDSQLL